MPEEVYQVLLIIIVVFVGLIASNIAFDRRMPHYLSRKIGHGFGGIAYLLCYWFFESGWYIFILSVAFSIVLLASNLYRPFTFRGVGGAGRGQKAISEAAFPLSAVLVVGVGWIMLGHPSIVLACLLFMAWGDMVTGIVRSAVYGRAVKGAAGSWAMTAVCVVIAYLLVDPWWVGGIGAGVAVAAEKNCGDVSPITWLRKVDDNFAIPVAAAIVMLPLVEIFGNS